MFALQFKEELMIIVIPASTMSTGLCQEPLWQIDWTLSKQKNLVQIKRLNKLGIVGLKMLPWPWISWLNCLNDAWRTLRIVIAILYDLHPQRSLRMYILVTFLSPKTFQTALKDPQGSYKIWQRIYFKILVKSSLILIDYHNSPWGSQRILAKIQ